MSVDAETRALVAEYGRLRRTKAYREFIRAQREDEQSEELDYESFAPGELPVVGAAPRSPRRILIFQKRVAVLWLRKLKLLPRDALIVEVYRRLDDEAADVLADLARWAGGPVSCCGDLDPFALHNFLELTAQLAQRGRSTRWIGIDDAWLEGAHPDAFIRMDGLELQHAAALQPMAQALAGPEAALLLGRGRKLELEGALNPGLNSINRLRRIGQLISARPRRARQSAS